MRALDSVLVLLDQLVAPLERLEQVVGSRQPRRPEHAEKGQRLEVAGEERYDQRDDDDEIGDGHPVQALPQRLLGDVDPCREIEAEDDGECQIDPDQPMRLGDEGDREEEDDRRHIEDDEAVLEASRPFVGAEIEITQHALQRDGRLLRKRLLLGGGVLVRHCVRRSSMLLQVTGSMTCCW